LNFSRKSDPKKVTIHPEVTGNNKGALVWGIYIGIVINAEDVFVFESIKNRKDMRLVQYEKMKAGMAPFFLTKKVNVTMLYNKMNLDFKKLCEDSLLLN